MELPIREGLQHFNAVVHEAGTFKVKIFAIGVDVDVMLLLKGKK